MELILGGLNSEISVLDAHPALELLRRNAAEIGLGT